jgi:ABC-2 type transport system ATP-binding protein
VRELCERVIIIDEGNIIYDGNLDKIVKNYIQDKYITLTFLKDVEKADIEKFGKLIEMEDNLATISVPRSEVPKVSAQILEALPVDDVDIKEMDLDEVVRKIFSGEASENGALDGGRGK